MNRNHKRHAGFTLIEIMVVIVILGLLAGVVAPQVIRYLEDAKVQTTKSNIRSLKETLKLYKLKKGKYPSTSQGLEVLTQPDKTGEPFLDGEVPKDGWGNPFIYKRRGSKFEIISYGADGRDGGEGYNADISSDNLQEDQT